MSDMIQITLKKSGIGKPESQRRIIKALGLRKLGGSVVKKDNNCIRGMVNKIKHLVDYKLQSAKSGE